MSLIGRLALVVCIIASAALAASPPEHVAWRWNLEERIAHRFDPQAAQERYQRAAREGLIDAKQPAERANVVIGRYNPELFLPFELFPYLIRDGFHHDPAKRAAVRERWNPLIAGAKTPDAFWSALERSLAGFIANQKQEEDLLAALNAATSDEQRQRIRGELSRVQASQCELQHQALQSASAAVGQETLYRVLYEGIAPAISTVSREPELRSRLQFIARGCR